MDLFDDVRSAVHRALVSARSAPGFTSGAFETAVSQIVREAMIAGES